MTAPVNTPYDLHQDVRRTIVPFDEMSPFVQCHYCYIEDDQFYNHIGIDFMAIIRSMVINLKKLVILFWRWRLYHHPTSN